MFGTLKKKEQILIIMNFMFGTLHNNNNDSKFYIWYTV